MNDNNSILLLDPTFNQSTASACSLLVDIGRDSFSYAIINKVTKQAIAVYNEQECVNSLLTLTNLFKTDLYLNLIYDETIVAVFTEDEINIPNDLFDENSVELHSKLLKNNATINLYTQNNFGFTTIFGLNETLQSCISTQFNILKIYPHNAGLLTLAERSENSQLFLDFSATSFCALFVKENQLIFQKNYEISTLEEFNYFILLIINQLNLQDLEIEIQLSGIIHLNDYRHQCLQKYFDKIKFYTVNPDLDTNILENMPLHYYTNLLALAQCV